MHIVLGHLLGPFFGYSICFRVEEGADTTVVVFTGEDSEEGGDPRSKQLIIILWYAAQLYI